MISRLTCPAVAVAARVYRWAIKRVPSGRGGGRIRVCKGRCGEGAGRRAGADGPSGFVHSPVVLLSLVRACRALPLLGRGWVGAASGCCRRAC